MSTGDVPKLSMPTRDVIDLTDEVDAADVPAHDTSGPGVQMVAEKYGVEEYLPLDGTHLNVPYALIKLARALKLLQAQVHADDDDDDGDDSADEDYEQDSADEAESDDDEEDSRTDASEGDGEAG